MGCGRDECKPGCECDRYLEFYNLVFMQYDRDEAGVLTPLPKQNIDTGMGLERISSIVQDVESVFDTDGFQKIIGWAESTGGVTYGSDRAVTKALRILADHGRSMTFLASDGVAPSNEGRGYVLRRVVRRAVLQADRIGLVNAVDGSVLEQLTGQVVAAFGDQYPELVEQRKTVVALLAAEEERFLQTLASGSALFNGIVEHAKSTGTTAVPGADAFKLHDTYGFPVELTEELAVEAGLTIDRDEFDRLMQEQRERARAAAGGGDIPADVVAAFARSHVKTEFIGYSTMEVTTKVAASQALDDGVQLIKLQQSPFYAQGGGQVSDTGTLDGPSGRGRVTDVVRFEDDQVLVVEVDGSLGTGDDVTARVDPTHRLPTQLNHTATHLLHRALRDRLGDHVRQAGSLVAPDRLRFDFAHATALTADELDDVERAVNAHIALGEPVNWSEISIDEARERGAMMLFGEKYGDRVRFVEVGDGYSRELCGGTHVNNTSRIQLFVVTGESSVGADARRIEAVTGDRAIQLLRERARAAEAAASELNVPVEQLAEKAAELAKRARVLERELSSARSGSSLEEALGAVEEIDGVSFVVFRDDALTGDELLELSDRLRGKVAGMLLASANGDKVSLVASMDDCGLERGGHAGDLIKRIAPVVGGGGGGRPNMARAGGRDVAKLDDALAEGRVALSEMLAGAARGAAR
jgi:alanyl-tRNA synthetase